MNQFIGIPAELLFSIIGAFGVYIFFDHKKGNEKDFANLEKKIGEKFYDLHQELVETKKKMEKIETGEFVEKTVHNVFNSPDFRKDLKEIIKESIMSVERHDKNNLKSALLSILSEIELIGKKIK